MTPYYEHAGITIYHGDCREVLPTLTFGSIITDPPYGINLDVSSRWPWLSEHLPVEGDGSPFDPSWSVAADVPALMWGANHFASRLPDSKGWLAWDKATKNDLDLKQAEIEFAWTNFVTRPRCFRHMWSGAFRDSEMGTRYHPTQKPAALMGWCIDLLPPVPCPRDILDPFMGSGPTLRAAKDRGLTAIGIETQERYCEIAAKRLSQEVMQFEKQRT